MMTSKTSDYYTFFEGIGFGISIIILAIALWVKNTNPDLGIRLFLFSPSPFLLIKLFLCLSKKEVIFGGKKRKVELENNPRLYWLVIFCYMALLGTSIALTVTKPIH